MINSLTTNSGVVQKFFATQPQKTLQADHTHSPRVINTDENAAYPRATDTSFQKG